MPGPPQCSDPPQRPDPTLPPRLPSLALHPASCHPPAPPRVQTHPNPLHHPPDHRGSSPTLSSAPRHRCAKGPPPPWPALAERVGFEPTDPRKGVNGFRDRPVRPLRHLSAPGVRVYPSPRNFAKKSASNDAHSSAINPRRLATRWLRRGSSSRFPSDPANPAFGSGVPQTTPPRRASTAAAVHMAHGSNVTYSVQPSSLQLARPRAASRRARTSACAVGS
jgi:hypothetical protein